MRMNHWAKTQLSKDEASSEPLEMNEDERKIFRVRYIFCEVRLESQWTALTN